MKKTKQPKLNLKRMLLMFALIPLVTVAIALTVMGSKLTVTNLEENTKSQLRLAAYSLKEYYEYDIVNGIDLVDGFCEYDPEYIDRMKENTDVDFTLFKDNIRFMTTIRDNSNARIEGTPASDAVWAAVSKGQDYYSDDVVINGTDYYVYYTPITDGTTVYGMAFSGKHTADVKAAERMSIMGTVGTSVAFMVIFTLIALYFAKKVAAPIKAAADSLGLLSEGDTKATVDVHSSIKESVALMDGVNKLSEVLGEAVGKIRNSAGELTGQVSQTAALAGDCSDATAQIAESMNSLAQTTVTMAESVQDINGNVVKMGQMVEEASEHASVLNQNAESMNAANAEASECIGSVVTSSGKSSAAVEEIIGKISETNEAVSSIEEMVKLITDIASQTNLLALNASIEAARAGEAGKGFAVVAEEIGKLATQSNDSANQIKDVVSRISTLSGECVESSEQVKALIDEEAGLLGTTQEKFSVLAENIASSVEEIKGITAITESLDKIKDTVTESVSDLSAISEETSATNEEVTASVDGVSVNVKEVSAGTEAMNTLAGQLMEAVAYFK